MYRSEIKEGLPVVTDPLHHMDAFKWDDVVHAYKVPFTKVVFQHESASILESLRGMRSMNYDILFNFLYIQELVALHYYHCVSGSNSIFNGSSVSLSWNSPVTLTHFSMLPNAHSQGM